MDSRIQTKPEEGGERRKMATTAMANGTTTPSIPSPTGTLKRQPPQTESPEAPTPPAPPSPPRIYTDTELAAAQNLVHLSDSSSAEDLNLQGSACSSSSSSPISVNTRHPPTSTAVTADVEETMDWEEEICPRRHRRYRSIPSLYEATVPMDGIGKQKGRSARSDRKKRNRR